MKVINPSYIFLTSFAVFQELRKTRPLATCTQHARSAPDSQKNISFRLISCILIVVKPIDSNSIYNACVVLPQFILLTLVIFLL